jgi:gas vesicle protein
MKLNKPYIKQLISEQLQEIKSGVQRGAEAIQPEEMPGAIAGLQANAAAQEAIAGLLQQTLMQVMEIASQIPEAQQIVPLIQSALEQIPEVAEEASKSAMG